MNKTLLYYDDNAQELTQRYESANIKHIHALLKKTFSPKSVLLELGCGSGRDASFMYQNGYDILAIDGSKEMISEARRCHFELVDKLKVIKVPDELHFRSSSFDGVYSIATLMHFKKDMIDRTLKIIFTILKPNGKFLFSVPIHRDDVDTEGQDEKGRYFTTMSENEWIDCCRKHGLKSEHTEVSGDGLDRDGIIWLSCIVRKVV